MGQVTHKKSYSKIYRTWTAMLSRCRNPNDCNYKNYGARGIKVCQRWEKFENFYADMGELPFYNAQLDRIDNEKGYFPDNCRWVTAKENSRNRRTSKYLTFHKEIFTQQDFIEKIGWSKNQFRWYSKRYGLFWIIENYKNGTLPLRKNKNIDRNDLIGKKFGKWVVLKFISYSKPKGHYYLCRCACGIEKNIQRHNLISGKTTQCRSCSAREFHKNKKIM